MDSEDLPAVVKPKEKSYLPKDAIFVDLSELNNPTERAMAAEEVGNEALSRLRANKGLVSHLFNPEEIQKDEKLPEKIFGKFRPKGKILGAIRLEEKIGKGKAQLTIGQLTVGVFSKDEETLVCHVRGSDNWENSHDPVSGLVAVICAAIKFNPTTSVEIYPEMIKNSLPGLTESGGYYFLYKTTLALTALGFKPNKELKQLGPAARLRCGFILPPPRF